MGAVPSAVTVKALAAVRPEPLVAMTVLGSVGSEAAAAKV